jgi:hypothetical protein
LDLDLTGKLVTKNVTKMHTHTHTNVPSVGELLQIEKAMTTLKYKGHHSGILFNSEQAG